jgi:nickel/cobalt transporter (NiCoT) family protein
MELDLPREWSALCALVFVLGMKHGFDADHLATIDGLTRFNARTRPRLARMCGMLFSLGHGVVVVAIALAVSLVAAHWRAPQWLETSGAAISVLFLTLLGLANLHAVLTAAPDEVVRPIGLKGRWLGSLAESTHPLLIMTVGALFALSFDTISQAALFAVTAEQFGGWQPALALGLLFMFGMFVTDGVNGLWISRLIRRSDAVARIASRVMGIVVSLLSLAVAALGVAKWTLPAVSAWNEGKEVALGLAVVLTIALAFVVALRLARRTVKA